MPITFEQEADIPEGQADEYVSFNQDGKSVFMHKDLAEAKKTGFQIQGQLTKRNTEYDTLKGTFNESQAKQQLIIDADKLEAAKTLEELKEKLKADGNTAELQRLANEEMNGKFTSLEESNNSLKEQHLTLQANHKALEESQVESEQSRLATRVSSKFTTGEFTDDVANLFRYNNMIKQVDGKAQFVDANGNVIDGGVDGVVKYLNDDPKMKKYGKFVSSKPGVNAKGGNTTGGDSSNNVSQAEWASLNASQKANKQAAGGLVITPN